MHQQKTCLELFLPQQNVVFPVQSQAVFHVFDPILPLADYPRIHFCLFSICTSKATYFHLPLNSQQIVSVTRKRRDNKIPLCLSAPERKSLI